MTDDTGLPNLPKSQPRVLARALAALLLAVSLAACGGGGGSSGGTGGTDGGGGSSGGGTGGGVSVAGTSLTVEADRESTSPGGPSIMLQANDDSNVAVEWQIAPGSLGSVEATSQNSAEYKPPAAGTAVGSGSVNIIASRGDTTETITLVLNAAPSAETGTDGAQPGTPPAQDANAGGGSDGSGEAPADVAPGIYLIAGNDFGAGMRDGTGTQARFNRPDNIVSDAQGNLYVADRSNYVIRRIDAQGRVSVVAGLPGISAHADGGPTAARFSMPSGMAMHANGDLYVFDAGTIRRVTLDGNVTTVAGRPDRGGNQDGTGSGALFTGNPAALTFDPSGNLYIAERERVRRMTPDGAVTSVAGHRNEDGYVGQRFVELNGIAAGSDGSVYVTDGGFQLTSRFEGTVLVSAAVYRVTPEGEVSLVAGALANSFDAPGYADANGAAARFSYPHGIAIDGAGNLYVNDRGNHVIRRITPQGDVSTVAGSVDERGSRDGPVDSARFNILTGIAVDPSGVLYVTDTEAHTVRRIVPGAEVSTVAGAAPRSGSADGAVATALFNEPEELARDAAGNLYVADTGNVAVRRIASDGSVTTLAGAGEIGLVMDVAVDDAGNVFVADQTNRLVRRISPSGAVSIYAGGGQSNTGYADGPAANAVFVEPRGLALDAAGNLFVADRAGDAVRKITPEGMVSTLYGHLDSSAAPTGFGSPELLFFPMDIAVDGSGFVYTVDSHSALRRIAADGTMVTLAGAPFAFGERDGTGAQARFTSLRSVATDQDGNVYVADGQRIRRVTPDGMVSTVAGYGANNNDALVRGLPNRPRGLVMLGPKRLGFVAGNGVFELRLP